VLPPLLSLLFFLICESPVLLFAPTSLVPFILPYLVTTQWKLNSFTYTHRLYTSFLSLCPYTHSYLFSSFLEHFKLPSSFFGFLFHPSCFSIDESLFQQRGRCGPPFLTVDSQDFFISTTFLTPHTSTSFSSYLFLNTPTSLYPLQIDLRCKMPTGTDHKTTFFIHRYPCSSVSLSHKLVFDVSPLHNTNQGPLDTSLLFLLPFHESSPKISVFVHGFPRHITVCCFSKKVLRGREMNYAPGTSLLFCFPQHLLLEYEFLFSAFTKFTSLSSILGLKYGVSPARVKEMCVYIRGYPHSYWPSLFLAL